MIAVAELHGVRCLNKNIGSSSSLAEIYSSDDGREYVVADCEAGYTGDGIHSSYVDLLDLIAWLRANRPELL